MGQRNSGIVKHLKNQDDKTITLGTKLHQTDKITNCIDKPTLPIPKNGDSSLLVADFIESNLLNFFILVNVKNEILCHNYNNLLLGYEIYISTIGTAIIVSYVTEKSSAIYYKAQLNCSRFVVIPIKTNSLIGEKSIENEHNHYIYILQRLTVF